MLAQSMIDLLISLGDRTRQFLNQHKFLGKAQVQAVNAIHKCLCKNVYKLDSSI